MKAVALLDTPTLVLAAVPPITAVVSGIAWSASPRLQRKRLVRVALIVSLSLTAIEVMLAGLMLFVLWLTVDTAF